MSHDKHLHADLSEPLLTDLARCWKADKTGQPRPAPPADPAAARALLEDYRREAARHIHDTRSAYYLDRAAQIRTALEH